MDKKLMKTRVVDMTGEELVSLIREASTDAPINNVHKEESTITNSKMLLRGYKELSVFLKCSVPTACRIVARGDISKPAIIRSGKTLLFNPDLVVQQLTAVDSRWQTCKDNKHN